MNMCSATWPGVMPGVRKPCNEPACVQIQGKWYCISHATIDLDNLLSPENFPPCDELRGLAVEEVRALKAALRAALGGKEQR